MTVQPHDCTILVVLLIDLDGRRVEIPALLALARACTGGAAPIIDEAFADDEANSSLVPLLDARPPAAVLKSLGKFFGLPSVRLGFAIGKISLIEAVAHRRGDWPVSSAAMVIGGAALRDHGWHDRTRSRLLTVAGALDHILYSACVEIEGGTTLLRLCRTADAAAFHADLARQHVWARIFDHPCVSRVGLLPEDEAFERFADLLHGLVLSP